MLADAVASNLSVKVADKQALLGELDPARRLEMVFAFMEGELGVLQVEKKIRSRVKRQMEKTQREYYLNEQLKAIQRELGNESEEGGDELAELAAEDPQDPRCRRKRAIRANAELKKLKAMAPMSAEATVARNYLDVLLGLPWGKKSRRQDATSPRRRRCSTRTIMGSRRSRTGSSNISRCRRGPTSSRGRSCASSARRASARPRSAGRSPRRPGASSCASRWAACATRPRSAAIAAPTSARCRARSSPTCKKAGTSNPLFLLDEIDKLGQDFRGDPASALLEVLDPEQNAQVPGPLSRARLSICRDVMFVTTANSLDMPQPLLDRMEIIRLEGYTEDEKVEIAQRHLIPKQIEAHGLKPSELTFTDDGLRAIIREYTREAGVRTLEREIAKVARKSLRQILEGKVDDGRTDRRKPRRFPRRASATATASARKRTRSARSPGSPGPRSAANC